MAGQEAWGETAADMGDLPVWADRPRPGRSVEWTVPGGTTLGT